MNRMNRNQDRGQQQQPQQQQQNPRVYNNRVYQNRQQSYNQHYQNSDFVRIVRVLNRNREFQENEENIYERLDSDDDDDEDASGDNSPKENNDVDRNELNNEQSNNANHMYERIDNRSSYRGNTNGRVNNNNNNELYLSHNYCFDNRFGGLSRNCFSTDNVALATNGRYVHHVDFNCMCQLRTRLPFIKYHRSQHCNSFHDRLRYYDFTNPTDSLSGNARHYIYQATRNCRCSYCRGEYACPRFPISFNRLVDTLRRVDCPCRNAANCSYRNRILSMLNSAAHISHIGLLQSVNNPLYANPTINVGRVERLPRSRSSTNQDGGMVISGQNGVDFNEPSTSSTSQSNPIAASAEAGPSGEQRSNLNQPGPSNVSVLLVNNIVQRQHTCDDSCIRNRSSNVTVGSGFCQLVNRTERSEYHSNGTNSGRFPYQWWFASRWFPLWGSQNERTADAPSRVEEPRDSPGSDSDEG